MYRSPSRLPLWALPLLVAVAVLGYLLGARHTAAPAKKPSEPARIASVANVLLEYPSSWRLTSAEHPLSGLPVNQRLLLSPTANPQEVGLIGGTLPAGESSPLPASFLAQLDRPPRAAVVSFPAGQAYRYEAMAVPGYSGTVELYVIPSQGAEPTALACYAQAPFTSYLKRCSQIVAALSLVGQASYSLTPDAGYASSLAAVIGRLDRERSAQRQAMATTSDPAAFATFAGRLANGFASASAALVAVEPPVPARAAETAVAASLLQGRDAYRELAAVADAPGSTAYEEALERVGQAEGRVDSALESFALLGYRSS